MYCQMFGGQTQAGKMPTILRLISEQMEKVKEIPGFLFSQVLQNDDEMLVLSSWRTEKDLRAYLRSQLAQETLACITPLLVGAPTVKSFPLHLAREAEEELIAVQPMGQGRSLPRLVQL